MKYEKLTATSSDYMKLNEKLYTEKSENFSQNISQQIAQRKKHKK